MSEKKFEHDPLGIVSSEYDKSDLRSDDDHVPSIADDEDVNEPWRPDAEKDSSIPFLVFLIVLAILPLFWMYYKDCGG